MKLFDTCLKDTIGKPLKLAIFAALAVIGSFGLFLSFVPIPSTVVASGAISTLRSTREISHNRGGVVKSINVFVGENVEQGQPLVALDQSVLKAELMALATEIVVLSAERESLLSTNTNQEFSGFSSHLKQLAAEYGLEESLLQETERNASKSNARSSIIKQVEAEHDSLNAQYASSSAEYQAKKDELSLLRDLISRKEKLQKEGFATLVEIGELKIKEASMRGAMQRLSVNITQLDGAIKKNELDVDRIPYEDNFDRLTRVALLSREVAEKKAQRETILEAIENSIIKAPISGQIIALSVNTVGGFLPAGQSVVAIAPIDEHMIIEARLLPREIHSVAPGLSAKIVFPTFPQREMLELKAEIESIATDIITDDRTGEVYYLARLRIPQTILENAVTKEGREIYAGLPVEVYLTVDRMTVLTYLLKPLSRSMRKTFRV